MARLGTTTTALVRMVVNSFVLFLVQFYLISTSRVYEEQAHPARPVQNPSRSKIKTIFFLNKKRKTQRARERAAKERKIVSRER